MTYNVKKPIQLVIQVKIPIAVNQIINAVKQHGFIVFLLKRISIVMSISFVNKDKKDVLTLIQRVKLKTIVRSILTCFIIGMGIDVLSVIQIRIHL